MRLCLFLLFMLVCQVGRAQVYFDDLYGADTTAELIGYGSCLENGQGYFVMTQRIEENWRLHFFSTDHDGMLTTEFNFPLDDTLSERARTFLPDGDSAIICLAYWRNLNESSSVTGDFALTHVSLNGTLNWRRVYGQAGRTEAPDRFIKCSDGGYLMVGQSINGISPNDDGDGIIMKVNSDGTFEFDMEYGGNSYDALSSVVQTPDSGFLLLGWTRSYGAGQRDFYLVKTDSLGNQQWQRTYGGAGDEVGASIMQLSDGNYLITGSGTQGTQQGSGSLGRVYKISPDGTQIWAKTYIYNTNSGNNLHRTLEMPNGDLVSVGMTNNTSNAGYLVRTDEFGNEIWVREYNKNQHTDLFYSVLATEDGGFLLSGQARNAETNSQDAWLLKVDSIGCPYPNCTVGIEEEEKTVMVDVWPNPAMDVLNIDKVGPSSSLEMTVFDVNGREILRFTQNTTRQVVDISTWPIGIYILRGTDNAGRGFSLKVAKQ